MLISYRYKNEELNFDLSYGCFKLESEDRIIFCQLAFELVDNTRAFHYLKAIDESVICAEEIEKNIHGGFFIVIHNKVNKNWSVFRDISGIRSGYFFQEDNGFYISTNVHHLAKKAPNTFISKIAVDMLLSTEFLLEGHSIYDNIYEFKRGGYYHQSNRTPFLLKNLKALKLYNNENSLSYTENKKALHNAICDAHEKLVGSENKIYLSGGIDSCVMLAALDEVTNKKSINNVTYRVKGTDQDETIYAKKAAQFLGYDCEVIEIDPVDNKIIEDIEDKILKMNNPYFGFLIFEPKANTSGIHLFGGQDTRLHTPDVNWLSKRVLKKIIHQGQFNNKEIGLINFILKGFYESNLQYSSSKIIKNLDQLILAYWNPEAYVEKIFFKYNLPKIRSYGLNNISLNDTENHFKLIDSNVNNLRNFYNWIVERKWSEQYVNDIKYMVDLGYKSNQFMQLPFYELELSRFSSSIPFEYSYKTTSGNDQFSNKSVEVNKVLLREAFRNKISPEVVYRKKAVSVTLFLLMNGVLGKIVKNEIQRDIASNDSLIKDFKYMSFVQKYLQNTSWKKTDQSYLLRIFYLYTVLVYKRKLM